MKKHISINGQKYEVREDSFTKKLIQGLGFKDFMSVLYICSSDEELLGWFFRQISDDQKDMLIAMGILERIN